MLHQSHISNGFWKCQRKVPDRNNGDKTEIHRLTVIFHLIYYSLNVFLLRTRYTSIIFEQWAHFAEKTSFLQSQQSKSTQILLKCGSNRGLFWTQHDFPNSCEIPKEYNFFAQQLKEMPLITLNWTFSRNFDAISTLIQCHTGGGCGFAPNIYPLNRKITEYFQKKKTSQNCLMCDFCFNVNSMCLNHQSKPTKNRTANRLQSTTVETNKTWANK